MSGTWKITLKPRCFRDWRRIPASVISSEGRAGTFGGDCRLNSVAIGVFVAIEVDFPSPTANAGCRVDHIGGRHSYGTELKREGSL